MADSFLGLLGVSPGYHIAGFQPLGRLALVQGLRLRMEICSRVERFCGQECLAPVSGPQLFLTNIFPGNWRMRRFISRPSRATETAELGKPL